MNTLPAFKIRKPYLQLPVIAGVIERRMLINFRCRPDVLQRIVPPPFRPKLIHGWGMAGVCLVRLDGLHPSFLPPFIGLNSENAAHRIAVEWDENGVTHEGVFIPRRDSNALFNRLAGGKVFPGIHHAANFRVLETTERLKLEMQSVDGTSFVRVHGRVADALPSTSIFRSLDEASEFLRRGSFGWSACAKKNTFDGLELSCKPWQIEPLAIERIQSSFFEDRELFPVGSAIFDSAFLMRGTPHEWHARGKLVVDIKL